eukprot:135159-Rhodomonas_salina.8
MLLRLCYEKSGTDLGQCRYAPPIRSLVLTYALAMRIPVLIYAMPLHTCYGQSGTEFCYAATRLDQSVLGVDLQGADSVAG